MINHYSSPQEQLRQVMAWYPNKKLYKRSSSKSGDSIISVYPEDSVCPVYSHEEWYADDWTPPHQELKLERGFFEQFRELQKKVPVVSLMSILQENAEFCHDVENLKNCYLVFDGIQCQDVYYSYRIYNSRSCVDVYWVMDSELLYECVYMFSSYNCRYSFNCKQASDSAFLFNCRNVQHCFMSSNLRNKQYYIYNKAHTKEEYEAFMAGIDFSDAEVVQKLEATFETELLGKTPRPPAFLENCENVDGNYIKNSKNCVNAFESFDLIDCENVFQCAKGKNIYGSFMCNDRIEQCFQSVSTGIATTNAKNCVSVWYSSNMEYSYLCLHCQDCFGCIGLRNKQFYIFNKAYSQEEYIKTIALLKEAMVTRGEYDRFFPLDLSPFRYEDTIAYDYFEGSEAEAPTMTLNHIPQELKFYKERQIPLPTLPYPARYKKRLRRMDTSFTKLGGAYLKHPESKNVVDEKTYIDHLN